MLTLTCPEIIAQICELQVDARTKVLEPVGNYELDLLLVSSISWLELNN